MRANMPAFGKRTLLTDEHFADFEKAFGASPTAAPGARIRAPRALPVCPEPDVIAAEILAMLQIATTAIQELQEMLEVVEE